MRVSTYFFEYSNPLFLQILKFDLTSMTMNINLKFLFICLLSMCYAESKAGAGSATGPSMDSGKPRLSADRLVHNQQMQMFSVEALNLKGSIASQNSVQQTNSAISLTEADINTISTVGNSWVLFIAPPTKSFSRINVYEFLSSFLYKMCFFRLPTFHKLVFAMFPSKWRNQYW